jgi:hypothetical protein
MHVTASSNRLQSLTDWCEFGAKAGSNTGVTDHVPDDVDTGYELGMIDKCLSNSLLGQGGRVMKRGVGQRVRRCVRYCPGNVPDGIVDNVIDGIGWF